MATDHSVPALLERFGGVDALAARLQEVAGQLRPGQEIEAHVEVEHGFIELFRWRSVVDQVLEPLVHLSLDDARAIDPSFEVGDDVGELQAELLPKVLAQL